MISEKRVTFIGGFDPIKLHFMCKQVIDVVILDLNLNLFRTILKASYFTPDWFILSAAVFGLCSLTGCSCSGQCVTLIM